MIIYVFSGKFFRRGILSLGFYVFFFLYLLLNWFLENRINEYFFLVCVGMFYFFLILLGLGIFIFVYLLCDKLYLSIK